MPTPHPRFSARHPEPLDPGAVLVAAELRRVGRSSVPTPAAVLLAAELRRSGVPVVTGPIDLARGPGCTGLASIFPGTVHPGPGVGEATTVGLGVAAGDDAGWAAARAGLASWLAVARPRSVLLAAPRSFCAGVERAIEVVERALDQRGGPIYVRRQIVHNAHVVADLGTRGAVFVDELDAVPDGATVVFSAHGVAPAVRAEAERRGLDVIDATCPLVTKVHAEARRFAARGDTVVLVGHEGHEEVEGTLGEAPGNTVLVETVEDVAALRVPDPDRVAYLTQTTLAVDEAAEVVDALRARFPALRGPSSDDICYATTNRQDALSAVAADADLVLVVGSGNSSNSKRLVELAHRADTPAYLVDDVEDLRPVWLAGVAVVGVTAGASAPPALVTELLEALGGLGPVMVTERATTVENIHFTVPRAVR